MSVFDKILGKKQKGIQVFNIPEKKYCHDPKKLGKMDKKDLADVISDMEKYIANLCEKLELGRKQFERSQEKVEETIEKTNVISCEMSRINNQHEQLQVKFTNLQSSLEFMTTQREGLIKEQEKYIQQHALSKEKVRDLNKAFGIYKAQIALIEKVNKQNKELRQKCNSSEEEYHTLSQKFSELKVKSAEKNHNDSKTTNGSGKQLQEEPTTETSSCSQCQKLEATVEGKEQLIFSLNKQISNQKLKNQELQVRVQEVTRQLQSLLKNTETKEEQLSQACKKLQETSNQVKCMQDRQTKCKQIQKILREQNSGYKQSICLLQNELDSLKEKAIQMQGLQVQLDNRQIQLDNLQQKLKSYEAEILQLNKENKVSGSKDKQIQELKNQLEHQVKNKEILKMEVKNIQEECQIKIQKAESMANQERIKAEAFKRNLSNLENRQEENRKTLDAMYENKMQQDSKIVQLEKKVKEYKHLIQYLRKEKTELEQTFEKKLRNMEEMTINEADEEDEDHRSEPPSPAIHTPSPRHRDTDSFESEIIACQNKIANLEEKIDLLKQENMNLQLEKEEVVMHNETLQRNIKTLSDKREEMARELKKMSAPKETDQAEKGPKEPKRKQQQSKCKEKKVAEKAYKGFDILAKQLSNVYKEFISIHVADVEKKQIKSIEVSINSIVRKSLDMKDIFQDYI